MSKHEHNPVDMSLPPEDRGRRRKAGRVGGTPPAQMDHASSPRARRLTRDGLRWLAAEQRLREQEEFVRERLGVDYWPPEQEEAL